MRNIHASVIIATHNRPQKLSHTLSTLAQQEFAAGEYEIIVVDDGSNPPVVLEGDLENPAVVLVRVASLERSAARNRGAQVARGELLIFIDDDISVGPDFVAAHVRAQGEWPGVLAVGQIRLPGEAMTTPFGRFREKLEQHQVPRARGLTPSRNFCTAANMSISRDVFFELGGFDGSITSGEDQDFALRHTTRGGGIAFLPEADAVHRDDALDIRSYCRRAEWGSLHMIPFCRRYPEWPDNVERERVNGPIRLSAPISETVRKMVKLTLTLRPISSGLFSVASLLERAAPNSRSLDRVYRLLLGIHVFRGYRKGVAISNQRSAVSDQRSAISGQRSAVSDRPSAVRGSNAGFP